MSGTSQQRPGPDGLVVLNKPTGWSSAQYVYRLRPILGTRKVGHAGTLDPFADGVLLACVGRATKLVERLMGLPKHYRTTLRLGVTNETFDPERPFEPVPDAKAPTATAIESALRGFVGDVMQSPPAYSALRRGGVQSYKLAKRGQTEPLKPRPVRIDSIKIVELSWPRLTLEIRCGRGTYIRAIARDLGQALACGACCEKLTRLAVGCFDLCEAIDLLATSPREIQAALAPLDAVWPRLAGSTGKDSC